MSLTASPRPHKSRERWRHFRDEWSSRLSGTQQKSNESERSIIWWGVPEVGSLGKLRPEAMWQIYTIRYGGFFFLSQPTIRYFQTFACRCTRHQVSFTFTFSLRKCVWDTNLLLLINCKRAFKSQRSRSVFQSGPAFTVSDYFISFISSRHRFSAIYERPTPHPSSLTDHK